MTTVPTRSTTRVVDSAAGRTSQRRTRALTVLAAALAALLGWVLLDAAAGAELTVRKGADGAVQVVGPVAVLCAALLSGLAGWALLALLERRFASARTLWTVTATVTLLVSLLGTAAATSASATVALASLHLLVGALLIVGLRR